MQSQKTYFKHRSEINCHFLLKYFLPEEAIYDLYKTVETEILFKGKQEFLHCFESRILNIFHKKPDTTKKTSFRLSWHN